jgi:hypothetical protein
MAVVLTCTPEVQSWPFRFRAPAAAVVFWRKADIEVKSVLTTLTSKQSEIVERLNKEG